MMTTEQRESAAYPFQRYQQARNDRERKGWLDYIQRFEPALYDFIKGEENQ